MANGNDKKSKTSKNSVAPVAPVAPVSSETKTSRFSPKDNAKKIKMVNNGIGEKPLTVTIYPSEKENYLKDNWKEA